MNSKTKTKFICHNCGAETPKWMGKCPNCGEWNSLEEKIEGSIHKSIRTLSFQSGKEPTSLTDIEIKDTDRMKLGNNRIRSSIRRRYSLRFRYSLGWRTGNRKINSYFTNM